MRAPRPGFTCLDDASDWKDRRGPDGITIIAQFEQATPEDCPGLTTGPAPKPMMLFDMEADRSELNNLAAAHPDRVKEMSDKFVAYCNRANVLPLSGPKKPRKTKKPKKK